MLEKMNFNINLLLFMRDDDRIPILPSDRSK